MGRCNYTYIYICIYTTLLDAYELIGIKFLILDISIGTVAYE